MRDLEKEIKNFEDIEGYKEQGKPGTLGRVLDIFGKVTSVFKGVKRKWKKRVNSAEESVYQRNYLLNTYYKTTNDKKQ